MKTAAKIPAQGHPIQVNPNMDIPTPMTSTVPRARCPSSVGLNQKTGLRGSVGRETGVGAYS